MELVLCVWVWEENERKSETITLMTAKITPRRSETISRKCFPSERRASEENDFWNQLRYQGRMIKKRYPVQNKPRPQLR